MVRGEGEELHAVIFTHSSVNTTNAGYIDHTNELSYEHKILKFDDIFRYFLCIYICLRPESKDFMSIYYIEITLRHNERGDISDHD